MWKWNNRRELVELMVPIYGTYEYDWMGYQITEDNPLTYHHIKERWRFGRARPDNGALLTQNAHNRLNELTHFYPELYQEFNYLFKIMNEMKSSPPKEIERIMKHAVKRMDEALSTKSSTCKKYRLTLKSGR